MLWPRHSSGRKDMKFGMYLILLLSLIHYTTAAGVFNCLGGAVYIVAHPDDDLLFAGPALQSDLASNACHTSIYLTSGDSGSGSDYAQSREGGSEAAYAQMMGVANNYTEQVSAKLMSLSRPWPVLVRTLIGAPGVQKLWFRLPDGNIDGSGYSVTGSESLRDLYFGTIGTINTVSMNAYYTYNDLQNALVEILNARQPTVVRTLDHLSAFDGGDHADHIATGRITREAVSAYTLGSPTFAGYMGYPVSNLPPTLSTTSSEYKAKCAAFFAYTPYDVDECQSLSDCQAAGRGEVYWLQRQYAVTPALATTSSSAQTPPKRLPAGTNVALTAVPSVSSVESGTSAAGLNDGVISGYPANETAEWATNHGGVGSWAKLTWSTPQNLTGVILYDRPNSDDWLQAGKLTFSDGRVLSFVNPLNDGTGLIVNFNQSIVTNTLLLTVTKVSASTSNVGLSELQAWGVACPRCALSSMTTTTPTPSKTTTSAASTPTGALGPDLARLGTATSSTTADGQPASAAIDGILSGYLENGTGNEAAEWSSDHQGVGATLTINFSSAQTMNRFILYDRPNLNDQITGATATFSDGSVVTIPSLPNNGTGLTVNFAQKTTTKVTLRVTKVSSTTSNIGLMEWQMYLVTAAATTTATATTKATTTAMATTTTATATATTTSTTTATATTIATAITITSAPATGTATTTSTSIHAAAIITNRSKTPTAAPVPVSTPSPGVDIALAGAATASTGAAGQGPERAKDGIIGGYTENGQGNSSTEWSTISQGVGAFLTITWSSPIFINQFILYDRPNLSDQITGAIVTFSDGSTVNIPALANAGTATTINFTGRSTTTVTLNVTSVSSTTQNVGLSEWQIFYVAASTTSSPTPTGFATAAVVTPSPGTDIALSGTASSSSSSLSQGPEKAIDGVIGGYTTNGGNYTQEWASDGQTVGATLTITWTSPIFINQFVLYDRPNLSDQITGGYVTFSDGSTVSIPALANAGTATAVSFTGRATTSVTLTVTSTSSTTSNIGLSEWQIYYVVPTASTTTTTTTTTTSSAAAASPTPGTDLAMLGTATSSSNGPGQGPEKASDGLIGGYTSSGGDYTQEWASNGQGVGATLTITWSSPITMNRFVMYDRPNLNDQVTAGTVTFSDDSVVAVPTLVNAGTATTINFSTTTTTTVVFTVTGVSSTTSNIGLSEWQIYYVSGSTATTSSQKSGTAQVESLPDGVPQVVASSPTTTSSSLTTKSATASRSSTTSSTRSTVSLAPSATTSSSRSTVSLSSTTTSSKVTSSTTSSSSAIPSPTTVAVGGTAANSSRAMRTYAAYMVASVPSGASNVSLGSAIKLLTSSFCSLQSSATTYDACSYKCDTTLACTYFAYTQATKICSLYTQTNAFGSFTPVTNGKVWNLFVPATNCTVYATATKNAACTMWQTSSTVCATGTGTTAWSVYPSLQGTGTGSAEHSRAVSTDYNACLTRTLSTSGATYFEFAFDTRMCYLKSTGAFAGLTTTINFAHTVLGTCASNAAAANGAVCIDRVACGTAPVVSSTTSSASKTSTSTSKSTSTRTSLSVAQRSAITGRALPTALIVRDRSN
ncbi:BZ3500_MvSof-1268-A1-R1_Chr1-3g01700 [Microbotryum saponariae]|uniref:N-acetylglucosaminylphosphatidylinositol deacetylase n=1 Tax=Microbotryum saponariae TaxID=289078 RepID=A0A2X0MF64_9BASI|nr:BZ3500_MvSof-1268-A1-R1_Chr1-3g01700 [Microbotryum saponariae]SCZ94357.1 BZ3501_MvSof-1269-A2-R1_Chr1-3g01301 [Microbotryum saponariae]